ncbi:MAG TPA: hypothetical protein PKW80_14135 [Bacteroidales bacterium]|nr:hypothetical protein [Bacteroidales bacterium]
MSFFKKVFLNQAGKDEGAGSSAQNVAVGRYSGVNKSSVQLSCWTRAQDFYLQKKYIDSFEILLQYMNDPDTNNIKVRRNGNELEFDLVQGSKIIRGRADMNTFSAQSRIARFDRLSVAFLRKLINMNFILQYSRFAIKDDIIFLKTDSKTIDASPNKIYYSLRELALKSDKMDDMLVGEFDSLHAVDREHILDLSETVKEIKYKYLQLWISETLDKIAGMDEAALSGGISYMLLGLLFRIDYLLLPQGNFFNDIDKINAIYNAKDNKSTLEKNRLMMDEFRALQCKEKEYFFRCLYDAKNTFGYVPATTHQQFYEFILNEFKNTKWYYDNRHDHIVTAIYEWMIGYSLFYYGLFPASSEYLKIAYMVLQPGFFSEMGAARCLYDTSNNTFNKALIEKEIETVTARYINEYPKLAIITANINYTSLNEFLYTYLNELTYLNYSKV